MYDDDGSEFISHEELGVMVDDIFGEDFDKRICEKTCDNCIGGCEMETIDHSEVAQQILQLLMQIQQQGYTCTLIQ